MTGGPRRARSTAVAARVALAVLAAATSVAGVPAARAAAPARAAPVVAAAVASQPVVFTVSDLRPRAPAPGGALQVVGTLRNTGTEPLHDLQLRLRVGGRLATRGDLRQADSTPAAYVQRVVAPLADLAPGAELPLDLRAQVDDLRLGGDGVYPVQVEVRGLRGAATAREQLGQVATYLPWFGSTQVDPLRVAWVLPVVDTPRLTPEEDLVDDGLAASLEPGGRLGRTLAAGRSGESGTCPTAPAPAPATTAPTSPTPPAPAACSPVPVTYAVDPDLLLTARTTAAAHDVLTRTGGVQPQPGDPAAAAWLTDLAAATSAGDLLALPYADPDVVALTRGPGDLAADVATARTYGVTVTRDVLGREPLQSVALPPDGRLGDTAFDAVTTGSTEAVVLGDDAVSAAPSAPRSTPGARVALPASSTSGATTGLVVDRALSDLLVPSRPQDARLAEQRWLVETAMIAAELPGRGRTLVVEAPRRGALDPAVVGGQIADTGAVPWICPVRLSAVAAGTEACPGAASPAHAPERAAGLLQPDGRTRTLSSDQVSSVTRTRADATQLTGAVVQGGTEQAQALRARLQRAWLRAESSAWRDDRSAGGRIALLAEQDVSALRAKVSVLTGRVTLTSNNGRVSVAVVNELDQPVTVALRLRAPSDARLSRAQTDVLQVPPRTSLPVQLDATTLTSGRFVVKAQLLDRDGAPFGAPQDLVVRSPRYGTVALAVTGLAAGVLLIAAGVRVARRAWRHPATPA